MGVKEDSLRVDAKDERLPSTSVTESLQCRGQDCLEVCRVCHCAEADKRGEAALEFLGISHSSNDEYTNKSLAAEGTSNGLNCTGKRVKFVSPDGEIFTCSSDLEAGSCVCHQDTLIKLGCSCKNELALAHYACALRWFISHGSLVCEICGSNAENVRLPDLDKVTAAVKDCDTLRARTAAGQVSFHYAQSHADIDPDALAAVRRQRLIEIGSWFNPRNHTTTGSQAAAAADQVSNSPSDDVLPDANPRTKWAGEGTGILVATGLLTVILAWLIAPHVGKKTAKSGLHILFGGLCALTVVIFLRFGLLPRIKYGPAHYWAIIFVFWFLVSGIWASRTRSIRST